MAAHSPGASQAITGTVNEEAQQLLADLADYLQQHSAQLAAAANVPRQTAQIVIDLRSAAAEPTPDPSRMRKILDTVRQIGIGAASVPAGAGLLDLVERPHAHSACDTVRLRTPRECPYSPRQCRSRATTGRVGQSVSRPLTRMSPPL